MQQSNPKLAEIIEELSSVLQVLENISLPHDGIKDVWHTGKHVYARIETKEALTQIMKLFPSTQKEYSSNDLCIKAITEGVTFNFFLDRSVVCKKKVIGKHWEPGFMMGGKMVEDIEWECNPSILKVEN